MKNMRRIFTIFALIFGLASFTAHAQNAAPQGDDSFAKYGQEFKGQDWQNLRRIRGMVPGSSETEAGHAQCVDHLVG